MDWRRLPTDELERQFNPRVASSNAEYHFEVFGKASERARTSLTHELDVRYGDRPLETLDLFPAIEPNSPIHLFIHGGYWRALDKSLYSCIAQPLVALGCGVAVINYDLCPNVTLDDISREIFDGLVWVARNAQRLNGNLDRITVSGHSAGAHLAAELLSHDWSLEGLPSNLIKSALLVSGIYDPEPVRFTSIQNDVRLTEDMAHRHNTLTMTPRTRSNVVVAVGGMEPPYWIEQSRLYHQAHDLSTPLMIVDKTDHFTIKDTAITDGGVLLEELKRQIANV